MIFGRWNQRKAVPVGPTRHQGMPGGARHAVVSREALVGWLVIFFGRKEANIQKKIVLKFQLDRSYGSSGI